MKQEESDEKITGLNDFNVAKNKITLKKGKYARIKVSLLPKNAYNPNITYVSSNKKVVQVDEIGMIHAKKKGKVTVHPFIIHTINVYDYLFI